MRCAETTHAVQNVIGVCGWRCEGIHVCMCWIIDSQLKPACSPQQGLILLEAGLLEWDHSHSSARLKSICTHTEPTTKWENYCTSKGLWFFKWILWGAYDRLQNRHECIPLWRRGAEAEYYSTTQEKKETDWNHQYWSTTWLIYFSVVLFFLPFCGKTCPVFLKE